MSAMGQMAQQNLTLPGLLTSKAFEHHDRGRWLEAEKLYQRALRSLEEEGESSGLDLLRALNNLATLYVETAQYGKADQVCRRAQLLWGNASLPRGAEFAMLLGNIASIRVAQRKNMEAQSLLLQALDILENAALPDYGKIAAALNNLAVVSTKIGERIIDEHGLNEPVLHARLLNNCGLIRFQDQPEAAEPIIRQALSIGESRYGTMSPFLIDILANLETALRTLKRNAEAKAVRKRIETILDQDVRDNFTHHTIDANALINVGSEVYP
jgi:tetratricopeptide (TPR) repeat protein